jgi:ABC-2 type transport system ATP-binding protein
MIEAHHLTKRYGDKTAVNDVTFTVRSGIVTGFLGPNGSGKSTTMRLILGLDAPTDGEVTVDCKAYRDFPAPLHEVGVLLEARSVHTGRSAYHHLLALAQTHGIPRSRVDELISLVGLDEVARKRAGQFSLGMGQRLGIAAALLGDPEVVILDEPVNGLDPEGIHWMRDHLIIIGRGRVIRDVGLDAFVDEWSTNVVRVRSPQATQLREAILGPDIRVSSDEPSVLRVEGLTAEQIGDTAARLGFAVHELISEKASLEQAFMELTRDETEYRAITPINENVAGIDRQERIAA